MKVQLITFCWDEMAIIPWAVEAWKAFADKVTVYDNGSDDGSVEYLQQHGIEVIQYGGNHLDNDMLMNYKNNAWKVTDADIMVVCDMDEIITGHDVRGSMERMLRCGGTLCAPVWYNLLWDKHPKGRFIEKCLDWGCYDPNPKTLIFDPHRIKEMNYCPGAHHCSPTGDVRYYQDGDIICLHVNNSLSLEYRIERFRKLNERRCANDHRKGYAQHYGFSQERISEEWENMRSRSIRMNELIKDTL